MDRDRGTPHTPLEHLPSEAPRDTLAYVAPTDVRGVVCLSRGGCWVRKLILFALFLCILGAGMSRAQSIDSTSTAIADTTVSPAAAPPAAAAAPAAVVATPSKQKPPLRDRIYFGGSVIVSFGDVTRIGIYPMIAYKFTPKLSGGIEVGYEYLKYDDFDQSGNNYGGSVFANYRLVPQLYAHAEYQMVNYQIFTSPTTSDRDWVPFFLVGGGYATRLAGGTWAYVEVLFDILNDDQSPYDSGEPIISAGVSVGF